MTETPAAAAPAATPAAPAASAPAATPAPAAPAAATPAPAPAPAPVDSLLPAEPAAPAAPELTEAQKIEAARKLVKEADAAADPNSGKAWLLVDGVMGQGEKPGWFKQDKYKTVAAQAEAYSHLEARFGSFTGAPKNEKGEIAYQFNPPEGVEFNREHPMAQAFFKWAGENQLSQKGADELLSQLIQYEAAQQPDMSTIKARLGDNADTRIANVASWGKANLGADGYKLLRDATSGANADAVFKVLEQVISKTAQAKIPSPNREGTVPNAAGGLQAIQRDHGARTPDGKLRVDVDPAYRAEIDKRYRDHFAAQAA